MPMIVTTDDHEEEGQSLIQNKLMTNQTKVDVHWRDKDDYHKLPHEPNMYPASLPRPHHQRIFPKAGCIVTRQSSLPPSNVDKLDFLSYNISGLNKNTA